MNTKSKIVLGSLIDPSNNDILAEVTVEVTLIYPKNPTDYPSYTVTAQTDNYRPDLNGRSLTLNLGNKISGEAFVNIEGIPGDKTNFNLILQGSTWYRPVLATFFCVGLFRLLCVDGFDPFCSACH